MGVFNEKFLGVHIRAYSNQLSLLKPLEATSQQNNRDGLGTNSLCANILWKFFTYSNCIFSCSCCSFIRLFISLVLDSRSTYFRLPVHSYVQCPISRHCWHRTFSADGSLKQTCHNKFIPSQLQIIIIWFKHILFKRKGLGVA